MDEKKVEIPADLDGAVAWLKTNLSKEDLSWVTDVSENDFTARVHHGLGRWMRNNFDLWAHIAEDPAHKRYSPLAAYFVALGVTHPDDMSGIILDSFWRDMNGEPRKLAEQVQFYIDYWKKSETERNRS